MKKELVIIFTIILLTTLVSAQTIEEEKICKENCREIYKISVAECKENFNSCKQTCSNSVCKKECSLEKNQCIKNSNEIYKTCKQNCEPPPGCMNGTYQKGETFTDGCEICKCGNNGRISCKREPFCNKNVTIDEQVCAEAGGFYHALCNGSYFSIFCSREEFCICEGNNNYSCPAEYSCLKDFVSPNRRKTLAGWRDMLGFPLGEIGICAA